MCKDALGTTDFVLSDGTIIFRTHPQEKDKLIFQIVGRFYYKQNNTYF